MHKRKFDEKSLHMLENFNRQLAQHGIESTPHLAADCPATNHLHIVAVRIPVNIAVTVTSKYQIQLDLPYRRFQSSPDTAIAIIIDLAKKGTA